MSGITIVELPILFIHEVMYFDINKCILKKIPPTEKSTKFILINTRGVSHNTPLILQGCALIRVVFNDHKVYMIMGFIFKSGGWALIGIWERY